MVSSMVVFAWAGLVIFNIFLIGIIFWASASSWIFGLILNVVYMACLLCLALYVENSLLADEKDRDEENLDDPANSWGGDKEEIKKLIKQINEVIYMLFVLSLGTVGITLSINLGCNFDGLGDLFNGDDLPVKCIQQMARKISVGILFVSCAPVLVASFMIYTFKFSVPSMFLTFYLGLCMLVTSLFIAVETDVAEIDASINVFLKWWLMVTGALMVAIQSYLSLSRRLFLNVRGWTAFTAGLPYFVGACWVLGIFTDWWGWLPWIVLNCICIVPLLFLGFALGEVVYSSLGAIGLVLDAINAAWRFGNYISDTNFFFHFTFLIGFLCLLYTGGGVVNKRADNIHQLVQAWASVRWRDNARIDQVIEIPVSNEAADLLKDDEQDNEDEENCRKSSTESDLTMEVFSASNMLKDGEDTERVLRSDNESNSTMKSPLYEKPSYNFKDEEEAI